MSRFRVEITVQSLSGVAIAGGRLPRPELDRGTLRDWESRPMIPGSSLRGRARAQLEGILRALGQAVCAAPAAERMCPQVRLPELPPEEEYCLACRIFGSPWRPSTVRCGDLRLKHGSEGGQAHVTDMRPGVGISRYTGTAEPQRLYLLENACRGLEYTGRVEGELTEEELPWLLAALASVRHLGGQKARGLGQVELVLDKLEVDEETVDVGAWRQRLPGGGRP